MGPVRQTSPNMAAGYLILVVALVSTSCASPQQEVRFAEEEPKPPTIPPSPPRPTKEEAEAFSGAMAKFTQAFYGHMAALEENQGKNFVFSPLSLHSAMTLLYLGATEGTEMYRTLKEGLYEGVSEDTIKKMYGDLLQFYQTQETFRYGNHIWIKDGVSLNPSYSQVIKDYTETAENVDFTDIKTVDLVNGWISEKTNGLIPQLIDEFSPDTVMFLANALYFSEKWSLGFLDDILGESLESVPFDIQDPDNRHHSLRIQVPMMWQKSESLYGYGVLDMKDAGKIKVVTIPYQNSDFEMQLLIPEGDRINALNIIENELRTINAEHGFQKKPNVSNPHADKTLNLFASPLKHAQYPNNVESIAIQMPVFKIDTTTIANDIFTEMGISFTGANLERMSKDGQFAVSDIVHQAVVDVAQNGTTGAAATGVQLVLLSADSGQNIIVNVDRPFLFIVQDVKNQIPILVGRVMDPRPNQE